jgi:hypothetical protein
MQCREFLRLAAIQLAAPSAAICVLFIAEADKSKAESLPQIEGELKQWHKITFTYDGPFANELDDAPNPFLDYRLSVTFVHESGSPKYVVPGYFAADGNAANTSADHGSKWRVHFSPDKTGKWSWRTSFVAGNRVAINGDTPQEPVPKWNGVTGQLEITTSDKSGSDFRAHGRLMYVGKHHLQFSGSREYFLKAGADSPETLLAYRDFDGTDSKKAPVKSWQPHVKDWMIGDPTWKNGHGKGLIGAINYLSGQGCNAVSFLTYNVGGDGHNVWPFAVENDKLHYDCSKLDQWQVVFDHAQRCGVFLHFKLQEEENDDRGSFALDGGDLGIERKLYLRELVARFGYSLALNWNLGEENAQSLEQQLAMVRYLREVDPYQHHLVIHTFPDQQDKVYAGHLGNKSHITGASLQNDWDKVHQRTLKWLRESRAAGKPWVVANDEQGSADFGVPPDSGYNGFEGGTIEGKRVPTVHDIRRYTLWGNLMAGGAGVEYYFGYKLPQNDLLCEDFRSRERSWRYCRVALEFFRDNDIPFWEMTSSDALVGNSTNHNHKFCFAKSGDVYLIFLPIWSSTTLDLSDAARSFAVKWFDPRDGGELRDGSVNRVQGGKVVRIGNPPEKESEDWLAILR